MIETLKDLVRINSVNPEWSGPGEADVADYVRNFFQHSGIEVIEREVLPGRRNVIARLPGKNSARRVLLEAHMDTVSADAMSIPAFEPVVESGRLYGRGSCDVKSGLAAMMHAVRAIHESGQQPPCEVWLAAVVDEENAYRGVTDLIAQLAGETSDMVTAAALVAEPTGCRIARVNKGVLRFAVVTKGISAHSSRPSLGKNAISAMSGVIGVLEKDFANLSKQAHSLVGSPTGNIGVIEGGDQVNFVPDHCRILVDRRMIPGESGETVLRHYDELIAEYCKKHPDVDAEVSPAHLSDDAMETTSSALAVTVAESVAAGLGLEPEPIGVPFGCDASKLSRAGIDSLIFGPGSIDQAHAAVEYVDLDQVEKSFEFYRSFLLHFDA